MPSEIHTVTGAFGYTGRYIARQLIESGYEVHTLTNKAPVDNPFGDRIKIHPIHFDNTEELINSLRGTSALYNTYWVRFNHKNFSFAQAVDNSAKLFDAAGQVGVKRIVHISITNPAIDSSFEYFSGKAKVERALIESGLSYAILRPAIIFGREDILINNIA